jgi:DNA-directed RNA polymerase subunit beta'
MKNMIDFSGLQIKLASPEDIRDWSHGEVTKPETINYRTQKPEKDGLFCEKIFGPTRDWECYCGKYKRVRFRGIVCDKCGVEVTLSRVRRERMGHIELAAPIAHVWFFKGAPSKLSLLLDIVPKKLASVIYFSRYLVLATDETERKACITRLEEKKVTKADEIRQNYDQQIETLKTEGEKEIKGLKTKTKDKDELAIKTETTKTTLKQKIASLREQMVTELTLSEEITNKIISLVEQISPNSLLTENEYLKLEEHDAVSFLTVDMGAEAMLEALKRLNLKELANSLREDIKNGSESRRLKAIKRYQVVKGLLNANLSPEWMVLRALPVMPPDLRPMVQLSGGRFAASDLNDLYRRVINRNNRLKHLINLGAPSIILRNEKRMLQEAVDSLIDASQTQSNRRSTGKELKSLSDMLKGKQGRFRQNLLGKRVDYSGRSVIVVGPELKLNQCGIPKDMALEMFKPFVLHELIASGLAPNVKSAKNFIERRPPEVFDILEKVTKDHPVLLNRAPTLHKLSIQAFMPVLVEGSAIRLHPVVCGGFNADFDGDQMAVHVPLTKKARKEAIKYMYPSHNLLKPSNGSPVTIPDSKEMAVGIYYMNSVDSEIPAYPYPFSSKLEAITAYQNHIISLRQRIKVRLGQDNQLTETIVGRILFNQILPEGWEFINQEMPRRQITDIFNKAIIELDIEAVANLIDAVKNLGFEIATLAGLSFAISDNKIYEGKDEIIADANDKAKENESNFHLGLITDEERKNINKNLWLQTAEDLAEKTWESLEINNPVRLIINSGQGRISQSTIKQLSAMKGLTVDPLGNVVELPTKSNYREGLSVFEYVNSTRGTRKGLTDLALRTADAGYLTRKLVDCSHDIIIRTADCGTTECLTITAAGQRSKSFIKRIADRLSAQKITDPKTKKPLVDKNELITTQIAHDIVAAGITSVDVRSPLTCSLRYGICAACYGWNYATNTLAIVGDPAGVIAAQSIGEPGTQLTMRTKHSSGAIGVEITQGLPRVIELFEVRAPKVLSPISEVAGKVKILETDSGYRVTVTPSKTGNGERQEYLVPLTSTLKIAEGDLISAGTQLASGGLDIQQVLRIKGLRSAQEYLIEEIQGVYESQGVSIHDKHVEIIVRQMSNKVRVDNSGDTTLTPGSIVSRGIYEEANEAAIAAGGEPAIASVVVLGTIRSALFTESWLSAASFQDTTSVLTDSACEGKIDRLIGMKENVIIGHLIPTSKKRADIDNFC